MLAPWLGPSQVRQAAAVKLVGTVQGGSAHGQLGSARSCRCLLLRGAVKLSAAFRHHPHPGRESAGSTLTTQLLISCDIAVADTGSQLSMADMFTYEGVARLLSNRSAVLPAW